jgi:hypothetical protein
MARLIAVMLVLLAAAAPAAADTRHATATNIQDGYALKGHDAVNYFTEGRPAEGRRDLAVEHDGATYLFATPANRDAFVADPARYLPKYGGYCSYGTAKGRKYDGDPLAWKIVDGRLYLNYNAWVKKLWEWKQDAYIRGADGNWPLIATLPDERLEAEPPAGVVNYAK